MDDSVIHKLETIRLMFELDREDDPKLYDDLIRFKKGTKRINRLRLLAHEGVLGQSIPAALSVQAAPAPGGNGAADSEATGSAFQMPAATDVFASPLES